jgi:hypothetical protein
MRQSPGVCILEALKSKSCMDKEEADELFRSKNPGRVQYTPKLGYKTICSTEVEPKWCWKLLCKFEAPSKRENLSIASPI